ncbi:MAG TPA: MlaD family protein [Acidimicrobiia bacterium]|nr:MlaD family protein [Acidimicrobiia bacterium]
MIRALWGGVAALGLLAGLWWLRSSLQPDGYELVAVFDDVGDLVSRHSVQMADVRIGEIGTIELTDDFRARVTLHVDPGVQVPVGSTALLRTTSLLGEKFVELRPPSVESAASGPFMKEGDEVRDARAAPELEFVADTAIQLLGAIQGTDLAAMVEAGGEGFGGQGPALRALIGDLGTVTGTLAERSDQLVRIIDRFDRVAATLAGGGDAIQAALDELAETTTVLAQNRERAVEALEQLARMARAQNAVLDEHFDAVQTQIRQVDAIVGRVADAQDDVDSLLVWLERFVVGIPDLIPNDFTNVFQTVELDETPD